MDGRHRRRRRAGCLDHPSAAAGIAALARPARTAGGGRPRFVASRSRCSFGTGDGVHVARGGGSAIAFSAGKPDGDRAAALCRTHRHVDPVQHLPGCRLLRVRELGADAAHPSWHHHHAQPAIHLHHCDCGALRTLVVLRARRPGRAQGADHGERACRGCRRARFRGGAECRCDHQPRRSPDGGEQRDVLRVPYLSGGTLPDAHSSRGSRLRLFVEPSFGRVHGFRHRFHPARIRHLRCLRPDCR